MNYYSQIAKVFEEMEKRNRELLKATSMSSQIHSLHRTLNLPRQRFESLMAQQKALTKMVHTNPAARIQRVMKAASAASSVRAMRFPTFPKINLRLPKIIIDYSRIEKITYHNSRHGWTLTEEIPIHFYLDDDFLEYNQEELDNTFVSYYEKDNYKQLDGLKEVLLEGLGDRWKELIDHSFELYKKGGFRISVPALITIIEGEISELTESLKVGMKLMSEFKDKIDESDKYLAIASYSIFYFFEDKLFKTHFFDKERQPMINRNWILHGRDNPQHWGKADVLRLLNTLATIQFIKTMKFKEVEKV
ncbi:MULTISPECIES: hypothetical protein [Bacillus]|uniref:hypothetical protein n=2 Tax=Bacillaceae TaxID=186817 RepID=UPI000BAE0205|nr:MULTISPECIES: hypothetical protein [Bacillus]POO76775.1 hypothetical protein C1T30_41215 [Bacillus sp. MBGLi97]MCY9088943.1 hypothetical protein [Bacillus inaquosorum]MEC1442590.1 hypothetical protein [Bacillus subtilis]PAY13868.1 hypothetical protein CJU60_07220 [Bacillus sp. 7705b]TQJ99294.1 hypothetical protein FB592_2622 [Bacillus sp. SJZ110]